MRTDSGIHLSTNGRPGKPKPRRDGVMPAEAGISGGYRLTLGA